MIFDYQNSQCLNRSKNEDLATPNLYERAQKVPTKSYRESSRKLSEKSRTKSRISDKIGFLLDGDPPPSIGLLEDFHSWKNLLSDHIVFPARFSYFPARFLRLLKLTLYTY